MLTDPRDQRHGAVEVAAVPPVAGRGADLGRDRRRSSLIPRADHDPGALGDQHLGDRPADPLAGAADERDPTFDSKIHGAQAIAASRPRATLTRMRNGGISFWHRQIGIAPPREPLDGSRTADVVIAGGGYTGLWAAYYLKRAQPELEIVVLEREFCGFGASGRNGGWISSAFAGSREELARTHGRDGVVALQRQMQATIDEVLSVARAEGIDADLIKPGMLRVARSPAQLARLQREVAEDRRWDLGEADLRLLDRDETERRLHVAGAIGAEFTPHCARSHPAKLVTGLARAVERLGVTLYEDTTVLSIEPGVARTDRGDVRAATILTCLEGFTASLPAQRRALLPLNSAMIVTDPLGDRLWDEIGWDGCELLGDGAHAYMYAQRTADGRIALGGRGVPYRFGSRTDNWGRRSAARSPS